MIDFRYHLVSLISVFLALAVGVVLGAGPLQNSLGTALEGQVQQLRADRDAVRASLQESQTSLAERDDALRALTPQLVEGRLTDRRVAVVAMDGANEEDVTELTDAVTTAGAQVVARVELTSAWEDPELHDQRTSLAGELAPSLEPAPPADAGPEGVLGVALAQALTHSDPTDPTARATQAGELLARLTDGQSPLASVLQDPTVPAQDVVLVAPRAAEDMDVAGATDAASASPSSDAAREDRLASTLAALRGIGGTAEGVVVVGEAGSSADLLEAVREDERTAGLVSTVDGVGTTGVVPIAVLTLQEAAQGAVGHYGVAESAGAVAPAPRA